MPNDTAKRGTSPSKNARGVNKVKVNGKARGKVAAKNNGKAAAKNNGKIAAKNNNGGDANFRPASLAQLYGHCPPSAARASLQPFGPDGCWQTTLARPIKSAGIGLHSGAEVKFCLRPAPADSGIVFLRSDLAVQDKTAAVIPALFSQVCQSQLSSTLGNQAGAGVGTVEHLLAACAGLGVDNAYIDLDGPEMPVMDGSALPFVELIDAAGLVPLAAPRRVLKITAPVRAELDGRFCELRPSDTMRLEAQIEFAEAAIGKQRKSLTLTESHFRSELAFARTFCCAKDIEAMRAAGLALGGSLENSIVVDGARVVNPQGLRCKHEFVRHKLLDALGDLYLAGLRVLGHYRGYKAGHTLHNKLLHQVFASQNFEVLELTPAPAQRRGVRAPRAAASRAARASRRAARGSRRAARAAVAAE